MTNGGARLPFLASAVWRDRRPAFAERVPIYVHTYFIRRADAEYAIQKPDGNLTRLSSRVRVSEAISDLKIFWGSIPPDPPSLACLFAYICILIYTLGIYVTPLHKILATGLTLRTMYMHSSADGALTCRGLDTAKRSSPTSNGGCACKDKQAQQQ